MRKTVLAAATAAAMMGSAHAQVGASSGVQAAPGGWSSGGWQAGGGYAPPATTMPMNAVPAGYPPAPPPPSYGSYGTSAYAMPTHGNYKPIRVGKKLPGGYADPIYTVSDWRAYRLEQPYPGTRWIRYYDEAVLVDANGRAIAIRPVAWNAPRRPMAPRMAPGRGSWTPPVASTHTERHGNTVVTTQVIPPPRGYYAGGYGPDYGWGPGVTVTPSIVTTTTTTVTGPAPRAIRHRRRVHRR